MKLRELSSQSRRLVALTLCAVFAGMFVSCSGGENASDSESQQRVTGSTQQVLGSTVETWAEFSPQDELERQGVTLPFPVLEALQQQGQQSSRATSHSPGNGVDPHDEQLPTDGPANAFAELQFPQRVRQRSFLDNAVIHFTPQGHPPERFTVPHFDFHFYSIPVSQVSQIGCENQPEVPSNRVPPGFVPPGECVPQMGLHSFEQGDIQAEEPFTRVMVTGYTGGELVFAEPMITLDFLMQRQDFALDLPAPEVVGESTMFPTRFEGNYDAQTNTWELVWSDYVQVTD